MLSSPNDGLLELVGHDELEGSLALALALASFRSMVGNPVLVPASFLVDCSYWDRGLDD